VQPTNLFDLAVDQAYWAAVAAVAAVIFGLLAVTVNATGLYLLWGQLKANREALIVAIKSANAATEAARQAQLTSRPWIKFEIEDGGLRLMPETPDKMVAHMSVSYENIGQTPATQVGITFKPLIVVRNAEPDIPSEFAALLETKAYGPETLFPGDKRNYGLNLDFPLPPLPDDEDIRFRLIAVVVYRAHATGELLYTPLVRTLLRQIEGGAVREFRPRMGHVMCRVRSMGDITIDPK